MGRVVAFGEVAVDAHELQPDDLQAPRFVSSEDPPDQLALDAVGLDEDEGTFCAWHGFLESRTGMDPRDCIGWARTISPERDFWSSRTRRGIDRRSRRRQWQSRQRAI